MNGIHIYSNSKQTGITEINSSAWVEGMYIIKVKTGKEISIYKAVKL